MNINEFDFELPEELIAKYPLEKRDTSRLLVVNRKEKKVSHHLFSDLPTFLNLKDLLVLNNTKVIPARIEAKLLTGGELEILLLESLGGNKWSCLVKPGKKIKELTQATLKDGSIANLKRLGNDFQIEINSDLEKVGTTPLPPYMKRKSELSDSGTYQTVFAKEKGSVAAPTAGLHFTNELLAKIREKGIDVSEVTLHVGYGTFAPIQVDNINDHVMHYESYESDPELPSKINDVRKKGGRVVAVGTTASRTLESIPLYGSKGKTNLYIKPGYEFKNVDALVTNFHTPKSSLYVLVCSLLGVEWAREVYRTAIAEKYRFYSYGDAMMIV